MCMHLWLNLINRTIDIQKKEKKWKSMYKVNGELSSCDITYSGRVPSREGDIHNFAYSLLLHGLSKSAQTFTDGFLELLSTHPIHIVAWGNFPFKSSKTLSQFKRLYKRFLFDAMCRWVMIHYMHAIFPDFPPFSLYFLPSILHYCFVNSILLFFVTIVGLCWNFMIYCLVRDHFQQASSVLFMIPPLKM